MVLTEFAAHPSVQHSVYLAALWPQRGQSLAELFGGELPGWIVTRDDGTAQISDDLEMARQALCADIDAGRFAAEVHPRYVLSSLSMVTAPSTAPQPTHPTTYIICEQDQAIPPQAQEAMAAAASHVVRLPSSHSPFLSMPKQLASVLGGTS
jgi:pimeloyl-ACP methyl ester carboxylesterase